MKGKPRQPSPAEKAQLAHVLRRETLSDVEAEELVEGATLAVFDDYVSDNSGYAGKLMIVIWPAGPQLYEVLIWRNGSLVHVDQEPSLHRTSGVEDLHGS